MSNQAQSWGRYPRVKQQLEGCYWRSQVANQLSTLLQEQPETLAFGNGRSYGDSCLSTGSNMLGMSTLNRFIHADWENGLLTAESGVTLADILRISIPNGWFLAVTPGTQYATLGGSIANDVHGKNHHVRGTFGCHVRSLGLLRQQQVVTCNSGELQELFSATVGGLGLTGIILWAQIQLIPINSSQISSNVVRFNRLQDFFDLSEQLDNQHEYSVAWVDCLASGKKSGRGVYMVGDHAEYGYLQTPVNKKLTVPLDPPVSLINGWTLKAFNQIYWHKHPAKLAQRRMEYEPFFYPLDSILHWNRIYGRKGFQQYQCVIPESCAVEGIQEVLSCISASGRGSFLAVLKRCGNALSPGLLSFPLAGTSLALDFPQDTGLQASLFNRLDRIVHEAGGRLYPAKDAHMSAKDFQQAYPNWQQVEEWRDPALNSLFWQRVTQ